MLKHVFVIYGKPKTGKTILVNLMTKSFSNKFKVHVVEDGAQTFSELIKELEQKAKLTKTVKYVGEFDYDDYFVVITHKRECALKIAERFKKDYSRYLKYCGKADFPVSVCGMEAVL